MAINAKKGTFVGLAIAASLVVLIIATRQELPQQGVEQPVSTDQPLVADFPKGRTIEPAASEKFEFDMDRLYDLSYETDPDLVEFASSIDVTSTCLIQFIKAQKENTPAPFCGAVQKADYSAHMLLPGIYETFCYTNNGQDVCRRVKTDDHPFEMYTDDQLVALSETSPDAAVILARRIADPQASAKYYERAVVLSGKPGPLEEWMYQKDAGGLQWTNGVLDIEKAKVGYGVYAITSRLGYGNRALQEYGHALTAAGVDIDSLNVAAQEKFEFLTDQRRQLTATEWEG